MALLILVKIVLIAMLMQALAQFLPALAVHLEVVVEAEEVVDQLSFTAPKHGNAVAGVLA